MDNFSQLVYLLKVKQWQIKSSRFMMMFIDTLIFLLWGLFFLAAVVGLLQEYQSNQEPETASPVLEDDDPVYLV